MTLRCLLSFCLCLFGAATLCAQQSVTFDVVPEASFVRVDGRVLTLPNERVIDLPAGTYRVEIWAPRFEVREVEIVVTEGQPLTVSEGLRTLSEEFRDYRDELAVYNDVRLDRTLKTGTFGTLTVGFAAATAIGRRPKLDDLREQIRFRRENYETLLLPDVIEENGRIYSELLEEFAEVQTTHNVLVVTTAVLSAASLGLFLRKYIRDKRNPITRPVFAPPNPFLSTTRAPAPSINLGTADSPVGITLSF